MHRWLLSALVLVALLTPRALIADSEDDRKDRRTSRSAVVLNITDEISEDQIPEVRESLMSIEGVSRVHVCAHTQTITIEFEANQSRCARRLIETVQRSGVHATLRDRVLLPPEHNAYRTSVSPSIGRSGTEGRPAIIVTRRRY